jgi:Mn2+/Fe2+ NRAMP family transporter
MRPPWSRIGRIGPGVITGASDDDPSGVATYAQAGAQFGYAMLWTALLTLPLMSAVQEICDRTALATGRNLGRRNGRKRQGRNSSYQHVPNGIHEPFSTEWRNAQFIKSDKP